MSDDLKERLRAPLPKSPLPDELADIDLERSEAADHIEALEARVRELEGALEKISSQHIPDQPAASGESEAEYARRHHTELRKIASAALTPTRSRTMSKTPWTPGPWNISMSNNATPHICANGGFWHDQEPENRVCVMPAEITYNYNSLNNARLIAAAPELADLTAEAEALISGDLTGIEWKRSCKAFTKRARATLRAAGHPAYQEDKSDD